ncbi:hypothetical protein NUACC21_34220 [Scytonema sp. NUACC21]
MTNTPESTSRRLDRIEAILTDTADLVLAHNDALNRIESAIAQLSTSTNQAIERLTITTERLTITTERLTITTERLAAEAAQDRQQAAIDRQEFRNEIRQIWEYLRDRNGGSSPQ